jgi:hypothetical protein
MKLKEIRPHVWFWLIILIPLILYEQYWFYTGYYSIHKPPFYISAPSVVISTLAVIVIIISGITFIAEIVIIINKWIDKMFSNER